MAIAPGSFYDINRDMYDGVDYYRAQELEYRRRQEEAYRRMQNAYNNSPPAQAVNPTPKSDPKDPLDFLKKADSKLLLTGEAS